MNRAELADLLASADQNERERLLAAHTTLADVHLAYALTDVCHDARVSDPARVAGAAMAVAALAQRVSDPEIHALAAWTGGMALLTDGQMEAAIARLDEAETQLHVLGRDHTAASTCVIKLYALAMLGRYNEAIAVGLRARDVFVSYGDELAAGKVEQNLGNIYFRREQYPDAELLYRAARDRAIRAANPTLQVMADNSLANVLTQQHRFADAAVLFEEALARAEAEGLDVLLALTECNLGCLDLSWGKYDRALDYLERSRRHYAALGMPHESAIAEQEVADAYLELNLAPEAAAIYERIIPTFTELGMRAEQARAVAYQGRASLMLGQFDQAQALLSDAYALYTSEGNLVGGAVVALTEGILAYNRSDYAAAASLAAQVDAPLMAAGTWGRLLMARWLAGESARAMGQASTARSLLEGALHDAREQSAPQVVHRCHTSLGLLAAAAGDTVAAEAAFEQAVAVIEDLRAPLPAEEFRTAFLTDKLTPYAELVRLCLANGTADRVAEALRYVERARSRALADMLAGVVQSRVASDDPFEVALLAQLDQLRAELNWFYSKINRPPDAEGSRGGTAMNALHAAVRERETAILEIIHGLQRHTPGTRHSASLDRIEALDVNQLQRDLAADTALVEYFSLDGELLAFVVTDTTVEVVYGLGNEAQVEEQLEHIRFQIETLHYGSVHLRARLDQLTSRVQHYLATLYHALFAPIEHLIGSRRLVVVPHRALHYVPFHALYDGAQYVIERREVCYVPSASVLRHCLAVPRRSVRRAVLFGIPDAQTPRVHDEVAALAPLFPEVELFLGEQATQAMLRARAPSADILHLACHGMFRPDNPLFSSLRLADGWLTVHQASNLDLQCDLVTLSACETGISAVVPGDELIGLARGFFSAGTPSLIVSLWTVDDESAATLMVRFYERLRQGDSLGAALRQAQCELLRQYPHPYFWSPFVLLGRW